MTYDTTQRRSESDIPATEASQKLSGTCKKVRGSGRPDKWSRGQSGILRGQLEGQEARWRVCDSRWSRGQSEGLRGQLEGLRG